MPTKVKGTTGIDKVEAGAVITNPAFSGDATVSGSLTIAGETAATQNSLGVRNLIINGDMQVAQRGTSATSIDATNQGYLTVDRWIHIQQCDAPSNTGKTTMSQSTDVPNGQGFAQSIKIDVTTAQTSVTGTNARVVIAQRLEGQNLQYLKKGTSSAESLTCSFWVKSNKTGTYILALRDKDNSRDISKSYTISSADTWEKKTITFEGDTTGAFDNDNARSLDVIWGLASGSDYGSGTLQTTWGTANNANVLVGQVNLMDSTSNEFYITGVQLEVGTEATPFEHRPYDMELQRCQRYYQTISKMAGYSGPTTSGIQCSVAYPIPMRATPTISQSSVFRFDDAAAGFTQSSTGLTLASTNNTGTIINITNITVNGTFRPHGKANTATLNLNAEL